MSIEQEFITIHDDGNCGAERLIRISSITSVGSYRHSPKANIRFNSDDHITTEESYDTVKQLITDALAKPQRLI